jgi:hypothetical protein
MATRWHFKEYRELNAKRWTWRVLTMDGSIERTSGEFKDYGAAMHDAIVNGFRPNEDYWIVETRYFITHFKAGQKSVIVPNAEDTPRPVAPPRSEGEKPDSPASKLREDEQQ